MAFINVKCQFWESGEAIQLQCQYNDIYVCVYIYIYGVRRGQKKYGLSWQITSQKWEFSVAYINVKCQFWESGEAIQLRCQYNDIYVYICIYIYIWCEKRTKEIWPQLTNNKPKMRIFGRILAWRGKKHFVAFFLLSIFSPSS